MAAPKGNKYGLGNDNAGRNGRDLIKLGNELIEWAKQPDSVNLNKFCCTRDPPLSPPKMTEYQEKSEAFREAFFIAKAYLGARREELLSSDMLSAKAYDLNAAVYDYYLKQERRDQAKFESDLKKEESSAESKDFNITIIDARSNSPS